MKNVADIYPLGPTQDGILYHALSDPDPELYFEQVRCELRGRFDMARFQAAWDSVVEQHPALRTAFVWQGVKAPVQVVRETVVLPWDEFDWSDRPVADIAPALDRLAQQNRARGFDLQRAPVSRFTIVRLDDERTHFIWDFHHILLDGWSATMVFDQAIFRYNQSVTAGTDVGAAGPTTSGRPVRSYIEWLQAQDGDAARRYWTGLLADHEGPPELAMAVIDPESATLPDDSTSSTSGRLELSMGVARLDALAAFARANRLTVNTLAQAAWAVALSRYADVDDVTFGVVTSGRPAELDGVEEMVGMFLSALPLRVDLGRAAIDDDWLHRIQDQQLDAVRHGHASLADIRRWAGVPARQELFDSLLVFENFPTSPGSDSAPLVVVDKQVFEQTHYGLTVMLRPEGQLHISTLYDRRRFREADVRSLLDFFVVVLERIGEHGSVTPAVLGRMRPDEQHTIEQWNQTTRPFSSDVTMPVLLQQRTQEDPDAIALIEHDTTPSTIRRTLRRGELDRQAERLSAQLVALGVGPGDAVGVAMERSLELIVALLGVWKAGAAYVPLDLEYPSDRLAAMIDGAGITVALTKGAEPKLSFVDKVIDVESDPGPVEHPTDVARALDPRAAACIIFTSGSTGVPKPVELHHRGIVNRCQWQLDTYPPGQNECFVAKTTLNFVDHIWEIWGPLLAGSPVVLVSDDVVRDPRALVGALAEHAIERLTLVPSLLDVILDSQIDLAGRLPSLTSVTVSGEALSRTLAARFAEALPRATLLNFYGMSEGTADATWFDTSWAVHDGGRGEGVAIGRPIANMTAHVLDRNGEPSPIGVAGELYVGGVGLANGYRGLTELTDEKFLDIEGVGRLYRTGDRVRWLRNGMLAYIGRVDRQLKIRGVRVEPAEVEALLRRHESIKDVAVSGLGPADSRRLVAHVVLQPDAEGSPARTADSELLLWARQHLPAHLVPSQLIVVAAFPTLPTGKIDRTAVSGIEPARGVPATAPGDDGPRTDVQRRMVGLWQAALGISDPITLDADFFDIGGDSLLAVRLFSAIDREFGRDLPLAALFEAPNPRAMIERLDLEPTGPASTGPASIETRQQPLLFMVTDDAASLDALIHRLGTNLRLLPIELDATADSTDDAVAFIQSRQPDGSLLIAGHGSAAGPALTLCQRLLEMDRRVETVAVIDAVFPSTSEIEVANTLAGSGLGVPKLFFFQPSEAEGRVPLLGDGALRDMLDDRAGWAGWADEVDTLLVPGDRGSFLAEPNVSWLAHLMSERLDGRAGVWKHLVPIAVGERPKRHLFAVHGEFGNVVGYRDLAVALGEDWAVVGVQASGVHGTQPLHTSIEEMAAAYLDEVIRWQPAGPYVIGGYSSGGTVALELARQLQRAGREVECVLWFDHYRVEGSRVEPTVARALRRGTTRLKSLLTDRQAFDAGMRRRALQRKAATIERTPEWWWAITEAADDRAEAEDLRAMLLAENMRQARSRYEHTGYDGRIILYQAEQVDAGRDPDRGWTDGDLDLERVEVPGDHTTLLLEPHVGRLADDLRARFEVTGSAVQSVE